MSFLARIGLLVTAALVLAACSGPVENSTVARQETTPSTRAANATSTEPDPEPADPTPTASPTMPAPTAISTPTPTNTPTATEEPTPTAPEPTATQEPTPTDEAPETEPETDLVEDFAAQVDALLTDREGHYSVVVIGPGGAPEYRLNDGDQLQAASLYKLLIMVEVYQQAAEGLVSLDDPVYLYSGYFSEAGYDDPIPPDYIGDSLPVDSLLRSMLMFSSNVASYALLDLVGNTNINATVAGLGMTASEIRWMPRRTASADGDGESRELAALAQQETPSPSADEAFNVTSAADMALLFDLLLRGEVVSPEASAEMLDILSGQVINDRLPALLPGDAVVAHKTGNIDNVVHDAGVIYTPGGPAVVVVLTADALEWQAIEFMQELALLVYQTAGG